jgi:phosphate/sulfate permease
VWPSLAIREAKHHDIPMEWLLPMVLIGAGFYVGWNIGANGAANCIGTTVGVRIISYRKAVSIMVVMVILAASCRVTT